MPPARWIGVFGGTFDPVHAGHLGLACAFRDALEEAGKQASIHLIPCHIPPHRGTPDATSTHRLAMLERAVAGVPGLVVDTRELRVPRTSYTVDTLRELGAEFPATGLILALGADAFAGFERWHRWRDILEMAALLVCSRPGVAIPEVPALDACPRCSLAELSTPGEIAFLDIKPVDVSSSDIRRRIAAGSDCDHDLPPGVGDYIRNHHLYR